MKNQCERCLNNTDYYYLTDNKGQQHWYCENCADLNLSDNDDNYMTNKEIAILIIVSAILGGIISFVITSQYFINFILN